MDGPASGCGIEPLLFTPDLFLPILSIVGSMVVAFSETGDRWHNRLCYRLYGYSKESDLLDPVQYATMGVQGTESLTAINPSQSATYHHSSS